MTEDEAKQKWCPFVRLMVNSIDNQVLEGPFNRMALNTEPDMPRIPPAGHCIASDCMAWRWNVDANRAEAKLGKDLKWGYCGLGEKL